MTTDCIAAAIAYLLGSIPFGFLLVFLFHRQDIRKSGSGNIGATNVIRSGSRWLGILTLLLDLGKGYAAVEIARVLAHGLAHGSHASDAVAIGAVLAVVGHVFPVWLRGRGGKGVATALGVYLALAPVPALCALGVFILIALLTRYVSLSSILAAASFPLWVWIAGRFWEMHYGSGDVFIASTILIPLVILLKHRRNVERLLHGTEFRIGRNQRSAA